MPHRLHRLTCLLPVATVALLLAAPAPAAAAPGDSAVAAAQQAKDAAAAQVGAVSAQIAQAQAQVDAAHAQANIALDAFQGTQDEYEIAQADAEIAQAAAVQADADLTASRAAVASFARTGYMQGSTSPVLTALLSADGPSQMIERAALLAAASDHRTDVLGQMAAAQQRADAMHQATASTLARAEVLRQQAADALGRADTLERAARAQAADLEAQQIHWQAELRQAQETLLGVQGARAAAEEAARRKAAEAAAAETAARTATPPPSRPTPSGPSTPTPAPGPDDASAAQAAIDAALRWVGTPYAWGGGSLSGPSEGWGIDDGIVGFDCSGLTRYAYAQAGIRLPRNSSAQFDAFPSVSTLRAGDLVFWATNPRDPDTIHHVALYLGNGQIVEAPESGKTVRVTAMRYGSEYIGGVRPTA